MNLMSETPKSFETLTEEILKKDACVRCGACLGLCPYLKLYEGTIVFPDVCDLTDGRCLNFCPKGKIDLGNLTYRIWGEDYAGNPLGHTLKIVMAKATKTPNVQYGGIVTILARAAVSNEGFSGAILTQWRNVPYPQGIVVNDPADIPSYGGSHYGGAYTLAALNHIRKSRSGAFAVVGLPCQILALRQMHSVEHPENFHRNKNDLLIGLFCTWGLSPRSFRTDMQRRFGDRKIVRYNIPPPPANRLDVFFENDEKVEIPLEEIRPFLNPGCGTCLDMTAEFADISVGAAEGFPGWNTVIIRSEKGRDLFERLVRESTIETVPLPKTSLHHLTGAAAIKKKKALNVMDQEGVTSQTPALPAEARATILNFQLSEES